MPDHEPQRTVLGRRPNILLITSDQLRSDCLGCYGHPVVRTPNLDALAGAGVRFENAYAASTVCVPSRQSIITGMYPSAHGAMSNRSSVPESQRTLADLLADAGYATGAVGKMHFHPVYAEYGFEYMRLAEQNGEGWKIDDYHAGFLRDRDLVDQWDLWDQQYEYRREAPQRYWDSLGATTSELPEEAYHTTWIADRSIDFLAELDGSKPFFLWTSFIKPHHPFDPPAPFGEMYEPDEVVVPPGRDAWRDKPLLNLFGDPRLGYFDVRDMTERQLRNVIAHYYGLISHLDLHVGRLVAALDRAGLRENTIIVFTADHGDYLGQYDLFLKFPNVPYDALAKVPLIVAGPGARVTGGRTVDHLASLVDLLPTFVAASGGEIPPDVQGRDLADDLAGAPVRTEPRTVFVEGDQGHKAVRSERFKLIYHSEGQTYELYDLVADPDELHDVAREMPEVVHAHLMALIDHLIASGRDRHAAHEIQKSVRFDASPKSERPSGR